MRPPDTTRRVRICRPAFQDMHHLVVPRMSARAQLRRQAIKLRFWQLGAAQVADLVCSRIPNETLFVLELAEGYGLAEGYRIVFCELPNPEPDGMICVLAVMNISEPFSATTLNILRGREQIARERLSADAIFWAEYDDD